MTAHVGLIGLGTMGAMLAHFEGKPVLTPVV